MALKIIKTITTRILIPFRLLPEEGLSPEKLAFSVTIGIMSGLFPVLGTTTIISILLTMLFRQNILVVQSVQWILALVQILLIVPFMQFGAYLLNEQTFHISIAQINLAFQPGILSGIKTIGIYHLYAILTWFVLIIPAGILSYYGFLAVFQLKTRKIL